MSHRLRAGVQFLGKRMTWQRDENAHITLAFLGDQSSERIESLSYGLHQALRCQNSFHLSVGRPWLFSDAKQPRAIILRLAKNTERLQELQTAVMKELDNQGFQLQRRSFVPHITLCRLKERVDSKILLKLITGVKSKEDLSFEVREVYIMKSTLTSDGAIYKIMDTVSLCK